MGKKRDQIKMNDDEVSAFIDQGKTLQLATIGKDGAPHQVAMWYGIREDGTIVIETFEKAQKTINLQRDPRFSAMLESGTTYNELRGVSIQGEAELIEDVDRVKQVMRLVLGRNHPEFDEKTLDTAVEMGSRKRVAFALHPRKRITWDHTKLGGTY